MSASTFERVQRDDAADGDSRFHCVPLLSRAAFSISTCRPIALQAEGQGDDAGPGRCPAPPLQFVFVLGVTVVGIG
jgi:hypothetical protein